MILVLTLPDGTREKEADVAKGLLTLSRANRKIRQFVGPWLEARLETVVRRKDGTCYRRVHWRRFPKGEWAAAQEWSRFPRQSSLPEFEEAVRRMTEWFVELGATFATTPDAIRTPWPGHEPPVGEDHLPAHALLRRYYQHEAMFLGADRARLGLHAALALVYREGIYAGRMEKLADPQYRRMARRLREAELDLELFRREHFEITNLLRERDNAPPFTRAEWETWVREENARRQSEGPYFAKIAASYADRRRDADAQARQEGTGKLTGRPATHGQRKR